MRFIMANTFFEWMDLYSQYLQWLNLIFLAVRVHWSELITHDYLKL